MLMRDKTIRKRVMAHVEAKIADAQAAFEEGRDRINATHQEAADEETEKYNLKLDEIADRRKKDEDALVDRLVNGIVGKAL